MSEEQTAKGELRKYLDEWFIQYNPLYFFSAFSLLAGLYLVSLGLGDLGWEGGEVLVTSITQVYECLLIAGAALLCRRARMVRPAVILGLLEVVFLFDCTLQSEVNANLGTDGLVLAALWVPLTALKLRALAWTFRLIVPTRVLVVLLLAAAAVAWTPQVMEIESIDTGAAHLAVTWYLSGLAVFLLRWRSHIDSRLELDDWGRTVLRRALAAAAWIWSGLSLGHLLTWLVIHDLRLTPLHSVPVFLAVVFLSNEERWVWAAGVGALLAATAQPSTMAATAVAAGALMAWQARLLGNRRLWVATVLSLYVAGSTFGWSEGPWPQAPPEFTVATMATLVVMAWRLRSAFALLPIPLGLSLLDLGRFGWGMALVALGFLALAAGVAINWKQSKVGATHYRLSRNSS